MGPKSRRRFSWSVIPIIHPMTATHPNPQLLSNNPSLTQPSETKELKRRVRDIIEPGRDLGHVDGKKKSAVVQTKPESTHVSQPPNGEAMLDVEQGEEFTGKRPPAVHRVMQQEGKRKFTPMDLDQKNSMSEGLGESGEQIKRNPDGTVCEDCN